MKSEALRIAIDAQFAPNGVVGGMEQGLIALLKALGQLEGPEQYLVVCSPDHPNWVSGYLGNNQRIVLGPGQNQDPRQAKSILGKAWPMVWGAGSGAWLWAIKHLKLRKVPPTWVAESNGFFESLGVSLVHVWIQKYLRTDLPTVFNPHDLQHEHLAGFFPRATVNGRRYVYNMACQTASAVVAGSRFTRDDVIKYYQVPSEKVWIIPAGPATVVYAPSNDADRERVIARYHLPAAFAFYPGMTWPHKNHVRLLEALVLLREQGVKLNLVCSGTQMEPTWTKIRQFVAANGLEKQVQFLGFVPGEDVRAIYQACEFVVAPSLFEQASGPMMEAWQEGVPVAASNITSLPDQAGDAAFLFNPWSVSAIADALLQMSRDSGLRQELRKRGYCRLQDFSWERTAKAYRALYRRVAGVPLSDEDHDVLGWDWMSEPRRAAPTLQPS